MYIKKKSYNHYKKIAYNNTGMDNIKFRAAPILNFSTDTDIWLCRMISADDIDFHKGKKKNYSQVMV